MKNIKAAFILSIVRFCASLLIQCTKPGGSKYATIIALFIVAAGCKSSQKTTYTPDNIVPTDKSLLWRISGNGLKQASYLFGTIHMIPREDLQFSEATLNALGKSKRVAFEIDMKEMTSLRTQFSLMTKAFMKNGKTLKDLLSAEDYAFVHQKMEEKGMGAGMFEKLKPMFLTMMLTNDEGGNPMSKDKNSKMTAVEMELWRIAKKQKAKSAGLETAEYQMGVFDAIPYEAQAKMLLDGLRAADAGEGDGEGDLAKMVEMYKAQDITAMQQMISGDEGMSNYEDVLLGNRNRNWIPVMGRMMREEITFFAVGAGHLGGPGGVIALLRKEGYKVEAVQ